MWSEISDIYNVEPGLGKYLKLLPIQYYNNITITSFIQHQEPEPEISKNVGNIVGSGEISVSQLSDIKRHRDIHIEQYK